MELADTISQIARKAKKAATTLPQLSSEQKNALLTTVAELLMQQRAAIQRENAKDLDTAREKGLSAAMIDRLTLSDAVIASMVSGIKEVVSLPDPVGSIDNLAVRPNGLQVGRMRVPLGVIAMIYESRPNVTVDAAALCFKAGNAVILRGGSEALYSNLILATILKEALTANAIDPDVIQVIPVTDREAVLYLLQQQEEIDLVIPRGGEGLIRFVTENSRIPVLKHYKGVCHIYIDKDADPDKAMAIVINAKTQRPGVCNALEGILVHRSIAAEFIPRCAGQLAARGVELRGCAESVQLDGTITAAAPEDWGREFLDLVMCVKVVAGYEEAREYIGQYGSGHTEAIITENYSLARRFIREIDASAVMVNASTRFNDGGELGLGAEIGISTTKLHAYGPMGLAELTTRKFVVYGHGQVRK